MSFTVVAKRNGRRGQFTGRQFFDAMMAHFGNRVKMISAAWSDGQPELMTNLDMFNKETKGGATNTDAAFATKTGKWASAPEYGFTILRSIVTTPDNLPGGYEQVLVDFVKPPKTRRPKKRK